MGTCRATTKLFFMPSHCAYAAAKVFINGNVSLAMNALQQACYSCWESPHVSEGGNMGDRDDVSNLGGIVSIVRK